MSAEVLDVSLVLESSVTGSGEGRIFNCFSLGFETWL
jgi:hypothetical protein